MFRLANPTRFMQWSGKLLPWCAVATVLLLGVGLYLALFVAPPDYQQGDTVRIMYVHVPSAWMASMVYAVMAAASAVALIWRHPLADIAAREAAPLGAGFTLLCLVTGSLWGEPMWGTWWVWDARLTSVLVLFFLYLGYIALVERVRRSDARRARRRDPGAGRRGQPADHQILGRLVEHAASAGERVPPRRPDDRRLDAVAAAAHGGRLHPALRHALADAHAQRAHGGKAPRALAAAATRRREMEALDQFLAMGGYARFRLAGLCGWR